MSIIKTYLKVTFPKLYISITYWRLYHKFLHWCHPVDLDEKINWMKFYGDTSQWPLLADKYAVRQYVAQCGYESILVPLYGKWDHAHDIDWDALPNAFVMKVNNGSGNILLCSDKQALDTQAWSAKFEQEMHRHISQDYEETHYDKIPPCIIAEQLLDSSKQAIPSSSLIDYKIWCFNGHVHSIWVCYNRTKTTSNVGVYDTAWNSHPEWLVSTQHYQIAASPLPRPTCLDQMITIASRLSQGQPQVRVDLYEVDQKVYFGELTLTSGGGFNSDYTIHYLNELGALCLLPTD